MKKEPEKGNLDPKLRNQLIYLVLVLAVALIAAIAGSATVAVQQSRVPWAETHKADSTATTVSRNSEDDDDIDAVTDSVDENNVDLAQTTAYHRSSTTAYSYRYRTYSYQYANTTTPTR